VNDFEALADFRYHIRRFLHFSEQAARRCEIEPQHHQLLLAAKGFRGERGEGPTVTYLAERLQLRHHSTVELIDRLVSQGLVERHPSLLDRRQVMVLLTRSGDRILRKLSKEHVRELRETGPALVAVLASIVGTPV
jgi:DNA-binding MarR family transcriptional regulator